MLIERYWQKGKWVEEGRDVVRLEGVEGVEGEIKQEETQQSWLTVQAVA